MYTYTLFYKIGKGIVEVNDYVKWAVQMVDENSLSPSLNTLMTFTNNSNIFEAEDYFNRACKEIDINAPDAGQCARGYITSLAKEILESNSTERIDIAQKIANVVMIELDYPDDLLGWFHISEMADKLEYDEVVSDDEETLHEMILQEAEKLWNSKRMN